MPDNYSAKLQSAGNVAVGGSTTRQIETASEVSYCHLMLTAVALGALTLVVLLGPLSSTAQAVTCGGAQRGTLNADNTFTQGTTGNHNAYRFICTGDADSQIVTEGDLLHALAGAAVYTNDRLVLQLNNAHVDLEGRLVQFFKGGIVVLGVEGGATGLRDGIDIRVRDGLRGDLKIESHATISTTGGADGINIWIDDDSHYRGRLQVHNFGSITTTGGGTLDAGRRAHAVAAVSQGGVVEVVNEEDARVAANGPGARGIVAGTEGSAATATNRGTITTRGNPYRNWVADGIFALSQWRGTKKSGGVALATNEVTGAVTTYGLGAKAIAAYSGYEENYGTAAIAKNKGTVTTHGNSDSGGNLSAYGVYARALGGTAIATNENDATIRTYGSGAMGLIAYNWKPVTSQAKTENRGTITTSGEPFGNRRAHGMYAWSEYNSAYATNHEGAAVTTSGRGARGVMASTSYGGPDETAHALNRGTVSTIGDGFHNDSSRYGATAVAAFSGGEASAIAVNAYEGVIETRGTGAKGMLASANRGGSAAIVRNRGRITTYGDVYRVDRTGTDNDNYVTAYGMGAVSQTSDATAINETGGVVETHGLVAEGVLARSRGGGSAMAVNRGRVITRGEAANDLPSALGSVHGSTGVHAYSAHVNAWVENTLTGRVDTYGGRAYGLLASTGGDGSRTSATARVENRGVVYTRGHNADAVTAFAPHGGTADNPNHVRAVNAVGAAITTVGDGSTGLGAFIQVRGDDSRTNGNASSDDSTDAYGAAYARNDGTVITGEVEESHSDAGADDTTTDEDEEIFPAGVSAANGVAAAFHSHDETTIGNAGDVTVVNTGDVTVKRENATGLYAETHGSGTATVAVMGGSVRAMHETGRGLWARTGDAGEVHVTIAGGARVAARSSESIAAEFEGGTTNVRLIESTLDGRVVFGSGTDTFTIRDGRVTGAIDFGTGSDTLNVHGDSWLEGAVSKLETLNKRGAGNLVIRGDTRFSSGGKAVLENGGLTFAGQFNLGTTGTMRIHDAARLTAVLADPSAPPQITAGGGITFDGDEELFLQVTPAITATGEQRYLNQLRTANGNPIANGTPVRGRTGQVALRTARGPATVVDVGHIPLDNGATQATGTIATAGVRLGVMSLDAPSDLDEAAIPILPSAGPRLSLGGGVSGLGASLFSLLDSEVLRYADQEPVGNAGPAMTSFVESRDGDDGLEYWARVWVGDTPTLAGGIEATVRGVALGVDIPLDGGFRLGVSAAPEMSVSSAPLGRGSAAGARLDGARYAAWSNWRGEIFHAGASASRGRYRAQSILDNPVAGGGLASEFDLTQDHVQLGAGARFVLNGVQVAPSLSVFSGALRRDAHTAEGAVFRVDVPAFSQRYSGWKSEIAVSPKQWLPGPGILRWQPALRLYAQRTRTAGPATVELVQHDRAGVLSFTSSADVSGLPGSVYGFSATVDALRSDDWQLQLGFVGMQADGDYEQMMLVRLRMNL